MNSINTIEQKNSDNITCLEKIKTKVVSAFSYDSDINKDNIKIIGHRGNQGFATENSRDAILNCSINDNIDGTEFDIRPTKDNKIVIMHNANVNGTTSSKGRIQDLTLEELKQLRFTTQAVDQFLQRLFTKIGRAHV